mmetsp:Transcript_12288/g.20673  ORF Transcript_12288/g.20673 Transcript_12288/m.20673 type:complete len:97 (-) Transcript_12288:42-332(-)
MSLLSSSSLPPPFIILSHITVVTAAAVTITFAPLFLLGVIRDDVFSRHVLIGLCTQLRLLLKLNPLLVGLIELVKDALHVISGDNALLRKVCCFHL